MTDAELIEELKGAILLTMARRNCVIAGILFRPDNWTEFDVVEAHEQAVAILPIVQRAMVAAGEKVRKAAIAECEWPAEATFDHEFARGMAIACALDRNAINELHVAAIVGDAG